MANKMSKKRKEYGCRLKEKFMLPEMSSFLELFHMSQLIVAHEIELCSISQLDSLIGPLDTNEADITQNEESDANDKQSGAASTTSPPSDRVSSVPYFKESNEPRGKHFRILVYTNNP